MVELLAERYRLDERIGFGGVGIVWKALDVKLERMVAVKTLDITMTHEDPEAVARFRREAVSTAGLIHPNIVAVYDTGVDGSTAYLVMELLSGPSLRELITDHGYLEFDEGIAVAAQVADALAAAHRIGIVHRDIKPGNIMLQNGIPKIVDFGIARLEQQAGEVLTLPATAIGTPAYISPEQALGDPATTASDIYSFGCTLMAMFAGRPPFLAEQPLALTRMHVSERPPHLGELRPDTPQALDQLVSRMLSKLPEARPSANAVHAELERIAVEPAAPFIPPIGVVHPDRTMMLPVETTQLPAVTPALAVTGSSEPPVAKSNQGKIVAITLLAVALLAALVFVVLNVLGDEPGPLPSPNPTVTETVYTPAPTVSTEPTSISPTSAIPTPTVSPIETPTTEPTETATTPVPTQEPTTDVTPNQPDPTNVTTTPVG